MASFMHFSGLILAGKYAICVLAGLWLFWALFVFTMAVYRAWLAKKLTGYQLFLSAPFVLAAGIADVVANLTVATALCVELPHEWLVTRRFIRYLRTYKDVGFGLNAWRYRVAKFTCNNLLNVFDPDGNHCENLTPQQASTVPVRTETE